MLDEVVVIGAGLAWLGGLFGVALWGERRARALSGQWAIVYALSLAVYCTSWTFYGTVTQAARSGWWLPPTFVGTILLYAFAIGVLYRLVAIAREYNASSIADLIAARFGRSSALAALVTAIAVIGIVPYIALQLKAVAMSYALLTRGATGDVPAWQDSALYVALTMALFAILFGTRRAAAAEHNRGLVLAMAFEAVLKLGAMLALATLLPGLDLPPTTPRHDGGKEGFFALIVLGALAMFTLPHQFHVGIVECREPRHLKTARWLFPLYMLLIASPLLPLARAGDALLATRGVPSDLYVLALPIATGHEGLALLAFLGGLSAATGMVILATLALSVMIGNHWLAPLLLRRGRWHHAGGDLRGAVLAQRRIGIVAIVLLAWAYSRAVGASDALADIGAISFSALATLAPAVLAAVYRPAIGERAVGAGIVAGIAVWIYTLLLPTLANVAGPPSAWIAQGPLDIAWLAPDRLFGLDGWGRLNRAVVIGLVANVAAMLLFVRRRGSREADARRAVLGADLRRIAGRFLPDERVTRLFAGIDTAQIVAEPRVADVEHELAAVIGTASARLLVDTARRDVGPALDQVATIVGEASVDLRFNQRLLEAALENMSQGICVVDAQLRVVAWNRRYAELFDYPDGLLAIGAPVSELLRHNIARGIVAPVDVDRQVARRLAHMQAGTAHVAERRFPDGAIVEIRGNPMPGGGFVATFTDVTAFRRSEDELRRSNETLELRVGQRTRELQAATREAQRANAAKSRSLAAVSHDLAQPLHAAHLFTHALAQQVPPGAQREAVANIDGALGSAEELLAGLLDVARLDAGGLQPQPRTFAIGDLLQHLAAEFRVLAHAKGLDLRCVTSRASVRSDPQLVRRVLQNFLANAVRYTTRGGIVLGCRRDGDALRVEVWDSGPGIADADRALIFEEFRRIDRSGGGLGLGLSIAERIARLLDHPLTLRSRPGVGSVFALQMPRADALAVVAPETSAAPPPTPAVRVLVVDNDSTVLAAMTALLRGWNCDVAPAANGAQALDACRDRRPGLLLLDYHLDGNDNGLAVRERLGALVADVPCVIITADHADAVRRAVERAGCRLLHKPLKPLALKSMIAQLLTKRAVPDERSGER